METVNSKHHDTKRISRLARALVSASQITLRFSWPNKVQHALCIIILIFVPNVRLTGCR
ncbi:uncharacterized protein K489DRAFT_200466 [Dissoconium aciculare CBS 342.82]|uniref:Uncharacterized protein n=1 Tax=Dissoconium aciculare CBS 342.82 TaxID=1314786 RepID=A0A6J3M7Q5_9PEZI|nr:uncharacterized protein K489DRAFT_200466 [Dissoconium aciculare CBS 342.82]KAF1823589.1 hypothetical protein K489DRAFT_200466 [Dissoconium aciculare CBS 342.82]